MQLFLLSLQYVLQVAWQARKRRRDRIRVWHWRTISLSLFLSTSVLIHRRCRSIYGKRQLDTVMQGAKYVRIKRAGADSILSLVRLKDVDSSKLEGPTSPIHPLPSFLCKTKGRTYPPTHWSLAKTALFLRALRLKVKRAMWVYDFELEVFIGNSFVQIEHLLLWIQGAGGKKSFVSVQNNSKLPG